jgi:hypothetical protein
LALSGQRFPTFKAISVINIMLVGKAFTANRVGFRNGDKAHLTGVVKRVGAIGPRSPLAGAD